MKHICWSSTLFVISFFAFSCGNTMEKPGSLFSTAPASSLTLDEANWEVKNLSVIAPKVMLSMKVPKNATLTNDKLDVDNFVEINVNNCYVIRVSHFSTADMKEEMDHEKSVTVNNTKAFQNCKIITEDTNGFVYSNQLKDDGFHYKPEGKFVCFLDDKEGGIYKIENESQYLLTTIVPDSSQYFYSEDNTQIFYKIIRSSAKAL